MRGRHATHDAICRCKIGGTTSTVDYPSGASAYRPPKDPDVERDPWSSSGIWPCGWKWASRRNAFHQDIPDGVRRQGFWDQERPNVRESLAHLVGLIMRRAGGDASGAFRASFV